MAPPALSRQHPPRRVLGNERAQVWLDQHGFSGAPPPLSSGKQREILNLGERPGQISGHGDASTMDERQGNIGSGAGDTFESGRKE